MLWRNVTGDGIVNNADLAADRAVQGQKTKRSNLRADVNTDGGINNQDIGEVKSHRGETLL